jgi:hypothetical protein
VRAKEYHAKFGLEARLRPVLIQGQISEKLARQQKVRGTGKGDKKLVPCPGCGIFVVVSKFLCETVHDARCESCKAKDTAKAEALLWQGLTDPTDYVTCQVCGYRAKNLISHVQNAHPELVGCYKDAFPGSHLVSLHSPLRECHTRLNLSRQDLEPYLDSKGRVEVAKAADGLGCSWRTVLNYARALGIPSRNALAFQKRVLDLISGIVGEIYQWEWRHPDIVNPRTGYSLFFDGYFEYHNLVVEAHGKQHFTYVPYWHKTKEKFELCRALDQHKAQQLQRLGIPLLVYRYDEPLNKDHAQRKIQVLGLPVTVTKTAAYTVLDLFGV